MLIPAPQEVAQRIETAMILDRHRLWSRWRTLSRDSATTDPQVQRQWDQLCAHIAQSAQRREERQQHLPKVQYDESLPIHARRQEIAAAIASHPIVIVSGETGSGKSTQLPKICLEMGRGVDGMIGHTQPRRIAARAIAARLAEELATPLGSGVGYKIRFSDQTQSRTYVKLMTDGILLAETPSDRFLNQYDTIILDEAHERSLNIDFLLGYLKRLLPQRPELRCIITSATIDAGRISEHFARGGQPAPVIEVSGRGYPVEVRYRVAESAADGDEPEEELSEQIVAAVGELVRELPGDVLVFLPTERDIRETATALGRRRVRSDAPLELLPLYARLSAQEQNRVFAPHTHRRIVLATNVAESSLTVPGIRSVIDTGTARISHYSPRSKVQRLPIEPISRASADQRAGRCGRIGPGICVRLYSEEDYLARDAFTTPEIRRTNLAAVILQTMAWRLGAIEEFPFLDPPRSDAIQDGYRTLFELGAIDDRRELTPVGRQLSRLPVDPRIGRMILAARERNCLEEILIIAAGLEVQDPRERPAEKTAQADECHSQFADEASDFLGLLKVWDFYHTLKENLSRSQLRKACRQNFLSLNRLREWSDIYRQLRQLAEQQGPAPRTRHDDYQAIHQALLTGLLSGIAVRDDGSQYTGAGGNKLHIWPGSALFHKRPMWIVAAELVETSRRYCRVVARIDPGWIEPLAPHLVRSSYDDPCWDGRRGAAMVHQKVTLFGLTIVPRRRVPLGPVDPDEARRLFIDHALVEGDVRGGFPFLDHNRQVLKQIEQLAAKQRRTDRLVGAQDVAHFYQRRLPEDVFDAGRLLRWLRTAGDPAGHVLHMRLEDLLPVDESPTDPATLYPDQLAVRQTRFPLQYHFAPGEDRDGVSVTVPRHALNQLPPEQLDWLVPGRLEEKITALIRTLPKSIRRCLVPAPDTARQAAAQLRFGEGPFLVNLARELTRISGEHVPPDAFQLDRLPPHLLMKVRVVDDSGKTLAVDHRLERLREQFQAPTEGPSGQISDPQWNRPPTPHWDFGDLPDELRITRGGLRVPAYPAIVDQQDGVVVRLLDTRDRALQETRAGVRRLYFLDQRKSLRAHVAWLPRWPDIQLLAATWAGKSHLEEQLALLIADRAFLGEEPVPHQEAEYRRRLASAAERAAGAVQDITRLVFPLFETRHAALLALEKLPRPRYDHTARDVQQQLDQLAPDSFLITTPWTWLQHFPRYFRAITLRLEKLPQGSAQRDQQAMDALQPWLEAWRQRAQLHHQRGSVDPSLETFRWMLEEFRVSLFAQTLGTAVPVSQRRLEKQWALVAP